MGPGVSGIRGPLALHLGASAERRDASELRRMKSVPSVRLPQTTGLVGVPGAWCTACGLGWRPVVSRGTVQAGAWSYRRALARSRRGNDRKARSLPRSRVGSCASTREGRRTHGQARRRFPDLAATRQSSAGCPTAPFEETAEKRAAPGHRSVPAGVPRVPIRRGGVRGAMGSPWHPPCPRVRCRAHRRLRRDGPPSRRRGPLLVLAHSGSAKPTAAQGAERDAIVSRGTAARVPGSVRSFRSRL